jgi:hypothetical protein
VLDTIDTSHDLRRFPLSYHSIKRFFFNLDVIPRRAPRVQNSRQRKLQAECEEFQKLSVDEKEFVRIRKNRDKALFDAVEDQCNDSVGLLMAALAYLHHDPSNDPPERKDDPPQQWFWDAEREFLRIDYAEPSRRRSLSIKTGHKIPTRLVTQESARVHTGTKIPMVAR